MRTLTVSLLGLAARAFTAALQGLRRLQGFRAVGKDFIPPASPRGGRR
jgi:hypothetical protein